MARPIASIDLKGDRELRRTLDTAAPRAAKAALRAGIRAMAREVIRDARKRLPTGFRVLRKSLNVRVHRPARGGQRLDATVGPTAGRGVRWNAWYAHIIERGAAAHDIGTKTKRVLVESVQSGRSGGRSFGGVLGTKVDHPGIGARPFLGPAFSGRATAAIRAAGEKIRQTLEKRLKR